MPTLTSQEEARKNQKTDPHQNSFRLLRETLTAHIAEFGDPILSALQGVDLSLIEVGLLWVELDKQADQAHDEALEKGSIQDAIIALNQKRQEIAARLLAAKVGVSP